MNKSILLGGLLLFCACSGSSQTDSQIEGAITLSGKVGHPQEGYIILEKFQDNSVIPVDTIELADNYTYSKEIKINGADYYRLNFYGMQAIPLILDDEDIEVNVDGNNQKGFAEVKGSSDHNFIEGVQKMFQDFQGSPEVQELNNKFLTARQEGDNAAMEEVRSDYLKLDANFKNKIKQKIDSLGASLGVIEIMKSGNFLDKDKNHDFFAEYADLVKKEMPNSPPAQQFVKEVEDSKKLAIGQVAPEIALPNPEGEVVKLSSLRGNYVMIDFWAKWCRPCRMENPNVVKLYNKYKDKGFEIYGVSLDRKKEDWLQAIAQDGLTWTQVSDLKFWNSKAAKTYNVTAIPFTLLLDPDGKIIGKNLRGQELENKLAEIFNNEG